MYPVLLLVAGTHTNCLPPQPRITGPLKNTIPGLGLLARRN